MFFQWLFEVNCGALTCWTVYTSTAQRKLWSKAVHMELLFHTCVQVFVWFLSYSPMKKVSAESPLHVRQTGRQTQRGFPRIPVRINIFLLYYRLNEYCMHLISYLDML